MILLLIFYFGIIGTLFVCAVALLGSLRAEAPFVPTGRRDMRLILEAAKIVPGETVYDLGSGDGRFVRAAARLGARAVGFEQSRILVWWSRLSGGSATFVRGDYLKENLGEADVIFCYLLPKAMEHLKEKFETELKPGTRIFSRAFKIPGWEPRERLQFSKHSPPVYVYIR